jgi:hypothetical protein
MLLDELKDTGWANKRGDLAPKAIVFELAQRSESAALPSIRHRSIRGSAAPKM